ncbi:MAG TPA: hypothetical protein VIU86_18540 [Gaiellaceae bacterium]
MARGTQHLKKRPPKAAAPVKQRSRAELRRMRRMEESGMFFPGLRRHAKWMFVFLALVFALGFVFFGVGSGSNGLGDILNNWLNVGKGSGPNIGKLEATTRKHPTDAKAFRDLTSAYEAKQKTAQAIGALERYTGLRPADTDALQELAGLYQQRLQQLSQDYSAIQVAPLADRSSFTPASTTKLGQAFTDTNALASPIDRLVQGYGAQQQSEISQQASVIAKKIEATYGKVVKRDPTDATSTFQYAQAAQNAGDTPTAIKAYRQAKKLDPSTYGAAADQALKQLIPQPAKKKTPAAPKKSKAK